MVDVEFPRDHMPRVYDALKLEGTALTLEVQQQLGDGIVRTIALGTSDGRQRYPKQWYGRCRHRVAVALQA